MLESLEHRYLLAAAIDGSGNLIIDGSAGNDTINVTADGANLVVDIQPEGFNQSFVAADVNVIGVNGLAGNDLITLAEDVTKPSLILAGDGHDTVNGGGGDDDIRGGTGADVMDGRGGADNMVGDDDVDTVTYASRTNAVDVSLDGVANDGEEGEGDNVDGSVDRVFGGSGNDTISAAGQAGGRVFYGRNGNDILTGGSEGDRLHGGPGDDELNGGDGDDVLLGTYGADTFNGGDGDDTVTFYWAGSAVTAAPDGSPTSGTAREQDTINGDVENITGSPFNDVLTGSDGNNTLDGLAGDDVLTGGPGSDNLLGGPGSDSLFAQDGEADNVDGGDDDDTAEFDSGTDTVVNVP